MLEKLLTSENTILYAVPPIRSNFSDHGPDPDFFEEIGPDLG